jgi:hypothetical protein
MGSGRRRARREGKVVCERKESNNEGHGIWLWMREWEKIVGGRSYISNPLACLRSFRCKTTAQIQASNCLSTCPGNSTLHGLTLSIA